MGAYTKYQLKLAPENQELLEKLASQNNQMSWSIVGEETKWYYHEEEMIELSKCHPETLFTLYGKGEESGLWVKYFMNGKMQSYEAEITYPPLREDGWEEPQ